MGAPIGNRNAAGGRGSTKRKTGTSKPRKKMPNWMSQQRKKERSQKAFLKRFHARGHHKSAL